MKSIRSSFFAVLLPFIGLPVDGMAQDHSQVFIGTPDEITAMAIGDQIGTSIGQFAHAYSDYTADRQSWQRRIVELQTDLAKCGECGDRRAIENELDYWQTESRVFEKFSLAVIDAIDDPQTADYAKILLGLPRDPEFLAEERTLTPSEYTALLEERHVSEKCIPILLSSYSCKTGQEFVGDPLHNTSCDLRGRVADLCVKGTDRAYLTGLEVLKAKQQGANLPLVSWQRENGYLEFYYGEVPDEFIPTIPPVEKLSAINATTLEMLMSKKGLALLTSIHMSRVEGHWAIACDYGVRLEDANWLPYDEKKQCPLEMPY